MVYSSPARHGLTVWTNMPDRLTFLDLLTPEEMASFFSLCDVLAVTSLNCTEAFGLVQVEAMLCGTPVVAYDIPNYRPLFGDFVRYDGHHKHSYYLIQNSDIIGLTPDERFDKHKAGIKANRFVQRYGQRLLPSLYEVYNPMPYEGAQEMEVELGIALREEGYGVWQG